jgi:hypothetical protein
LVILGIAIVVGGLIATSIVTSPTNIGSLRSGSPDDGSSRRIIVFDKYGSYADSGITFRYVKLSDSNGGGVDTNQAMQANSKQWFLNPFGRSMAKFYEQKVNSSSTKDERDAFIKDADAQEYYQLIRLPDWLGGTRNEIDAFRAYSAFDIASQCLVSYWPKQGRMDIEDPCHSNRYRPWDGLAYLGASSLGASGSSVLFSSDYLALPRMKLAVDAEGYLVAFKPDNTLYGDGVVGEGRRLTDENIKDSNEKLIRTVVGARFRIPEQILPGYHLIWLSPASTQTEFGHVLGNLDSYEESSSIVAGYRQKGSQQYYDYSVTAVPLSNGSEFELHGSDSDLPKAAQTVFNQTFDNSDCYPPQKCTYQTKSGDDIAGKYTIASIKRVEDPLQEDERYRITTSGRALAWTDGANNTDGYMIVLDSVNKSMESILQALKNVTNQ